MGKHNVIIFRLYPFEVGQKIYIEDGPRHGDWEVMDVTERKLKLRCPISNREVEWNRFCYFMEEADNSTWPHRDEQYFLDGFDEIKIKENVYTAFIGEAKAYFRLLAYAENAEEKKVPENCPIVSCNSRCGEGACYSSFKLG